MTLAKKINSKQFLKSLKGPFEGRVFLFLGEEEGEKDKVIGRIFSLYFKTKETPQGNRANFHIDHGKGTPNEELMRAADFALSPSMFNPKRICVIRNIDSLKVAKANTSLLNQLLDERDENSVIIFTALKNSIPSHFKSIPKINVEVIQFWQFFDSDIRNYIKTELNKRELQAGEGVLSAIIERTGRDIKKIDEALEMLHYSSTGTALTEDAVKSLVHDVRTSSVFEFIDALFAHKKNSFDLLRRVMEEGNPELLVLTLIARQAELLQSYHNYINEGKRPDEALAFCKVTDRNRDKFLTQSSYFGQKKLERVFIVLAQTDFLLKSRRSGTGLLANPLFNCVSEISK